MSELLEVLLEVLETKESTMAENNLFTESTTVIYFDCV